MKKYKQNEQLRQAVICNPDFSELSILDGLKLEQESAFGTGNILVKIWYHNDYFHLADFVQAFETVKEAKKVCEFVKTCKDISACYIVRLKPKYQLLERVVSFTTAC